LKIDFISLRLFRKYKLLFQNLKLALLKGNKSIDALTMETEEPFCCPHCERKLPFRLIMKVKNEHVIDCPFCGESVVPKKTKSFTWGYVIGFLSFVVPEQIVFYLHEDIVMAFLIGFLHALTAFGLVSLYLYCNTKFIKATSFFI